MARRPALRELAARLGLVDTWRQMAGARPRRTTDAVREKLLSAMGIDASSEASARAALSRLAADGLEAWLARTTGGSATSVTCGGSWSRRGPSGRPSSA